MLKINLVILYIIIRRFTMNYLEKNYSVREEKIYIEDIPCIRLVPKGLEGEIPTIIFYHGLDSSKERQRLRGYFFAFCGYQVILPDALHHGERHRKESLDPREISRYFWQAIINNIKESEVLVDSLIKNYGAGRIIVAGHSMGGFTTAGVVTHNDKVKAGIAMNGSFDWEGSADIMKKAMGLDEDFTIPEEVEMKKLNPINNLHVLKDKKILILHGEEDPEVSIFPQREFYEKNRDNLDLDMIVYPGLGHFVTTNMLDDAMKWIVSGEVCNYEEDI